MGMASMYRNRRGWSFLAVFTFTLVSVDGKSFTEPALRLPPNIDGSENLLTKVSAWKKNCSVYEEAKVEAESCGMQILGSSSGSNGLRTLCRHHKKLKMTCIDAMDTKLEVCLTDTQIYDLKIVRHAIAAGVDFLCHEDGARITSFVREGGVMCVVSQLENFEKCIKEMTSGTDNFDTEGKDSLFTKENCKILNIGRHCLVNLTKKCEEKTYASFLDSLTTEMLNATPCKNWAGPKSGAVTIFTSAHDHSPHILTLFAALLITSTIL